MLCCRPCLKYIPPSVELRLPPVLGLTSGPIEATRIFEAEDGEVVVFSKPGMGGKKVCVIF